MQNCSNSKSNQHWKLASSISLLQAKHNICSFFHWLLWLIPPPPVDKFVLLSGEMVTLWNLAEIISALIISLGKVILCVGTYRCIDQIQGLFGFWEIMICKNNWVFGTFCHESGWCIFLLHTYSKFDFSNPTWKEYCRFHFCIVNTEVLH